MTRLARRVLWLAAFVAMGAQGDSSLPVLYTLHCSGCHGEDGRGAAARGVPNLHDVGRYLSVPLGRQYLIEVPGVSQSVLNDEQTAQLLNYILARFSADMLPNPFVPYGAAEVSQYRADKASDAPTRRQGILRQLGLVGSSSGQYEPTDSHVTRETHQ
jgi:mono/diheme cytochrome c family protein